LLVAVTPQAPSTTNEAQELGWNKKSKKVNLFNTKKQKKIS